MIDFGLDEDQRLLVETVREFARSEIRPRLRESERGGEPSADLLARFNGLGLAMLDIPEALGGMGQSQVTAALVHEELAWGDVGIAVALFRSQPFSAALLELGDEAQHARLLRDPVAGACAMGAGIRARRSKGEYLLSGNTGCVLGSAPAVVLADLEDEGAAVFVVGDARLGPRCETMGLGSARIGELDVEGCHVGEADRLQGGGDLRDALRRFSARYSLINAARQIGLGRAAYEHALEYAEQRHAFGKPVAHFQAIAFLLADVHMEVESARWLLWRAASAWDHGAPEAMRLVSEAAVHAAEAAYRAADAGVQILGGAGYICDHPVEKWLRDTQTLALLGGSAQQHLMTIAAELIGDETLERQGALIQQVAT